MGFTKLDEGIVHSSIWSEALGTRVLWVTMLAMCDSRGFVSSSRSGLLRAANIPETDFGVALSILESTDDDSRSPEYDGRRVKKCDGGWMVLNYTKYREFTYSDSPDAVRQRRHREKDKRDIALRVTKGRDISASASASASIVWKNRQWEGIASEDMTAWSASYPACDIKVELAKMGEWLLANPAKAVKSNWRRFIVNWLSRSQDRGGGTPSRRPAADMRVGESKKRDHDDEYWARVRAKHAEGKRGDEHD